MKYLFLIFLVIPIMSFSQTIKVKLIDFSADKIPPLCGRIAFATTLKFELIDNLKDFVKGQDILVIIACPAELGLENYINNQTYNLTIFGNTKEDLKYIKYGWTILYKYEKEKLPKFWSKKLEIIK